jgi:hypothetical protein
MVTHTQALIDHLRTHGVQQVDVSADKAGKEMTFR